MSAALGVVATTAVAVAAVVVEAREASRALRPIGTVVPSQVATSTPDPSALVRPAYLPLLALRDAVRQPGTRFAPSIAGYEGTRYTRSQGLGSDIVNAVAVDGRGVAWLGTTDGASAVLPGGPVRSYTPADDGLPAPYVTDIAVDVHGDPWMTGNLHWDRGEHGALGRFDGHGWVPWRNFGDFRPGPIDQLLAIAIDASDDKWIGTRPYWMQLGGDLHEGEGGVFRFRGRTYEDYGLAAWTEVGDPPVSLETTQAVTVDAADGKWFVAEELVQLTADGDWHVHAAGVDRPGAHVTAVASDPTDGGLWVAASEDLLRRDRAGTWHVVRGPDGGRAPASAAVAMDVDSAGNLWYGNYVETEEPSGVRWADGRWHAFDDRDGPLGEGRIRDVFAAADGVVWFGTSGGAVRLEPEG